MRIGTSLLALLMLTPPAMAKVQAPFIDGVYTMSAEACAKAKALAAGTPRSLATVPWSVSKAGFDHGEGGCSFTRVIERRPGKEWEVRASCAEHGPASGSIESYRFTRTAPATFSVALTTKGASADDRKPVIYTRCDVGAKR